MLQRQMEAALLATARLPEVSGNGDGSQPEPINAHKLTAAPLR